VKVSGRMHGAPTANKKARPVLFSSPMVRALLEGRKTQTRRIVKPQPDAVSKPFHPEPRGGSKWIWMARDDFPEYAFAAGDFKCPYGQSGDLLWVREAWADVGVRIAFRADTDGEKLRADAAWKPSIHMRRCDSRLTLEIANVRVQRLQEITAEDAMAEGAAMRARCCGFNRNDDGWSMDWSEVGKPSKWGHDGMTLSEGDLALVSPQSAFGAYINQLHGGRYWSSKPEEPLWDQNPWVWALNFNVHHQNIDIFLQARKAA